MNEFYLEIYTPVGLFYKTKTNSLVINTPNGKLGIQSNYQHSAISLMDGDIIIKEGNESKKIFTLQGFVNVKDNLVSIFTSGAVIHGNKENLDKKEAEQRILEMKKRKDSNEQHIKMQNMISKALSQLKKNL